MSPAARSRSGLECGRDELLRFGLNPHEVLGPLEGLGVDLVDVLGAGGSCSKPGTLSRHFEPADWCAVARCSRQACRNRLLSLIHISEPTRRTPISYAVFCLKKK